jgi:hypothetical protein
MLLPTGPAETRQPFPVQGEPDKLRMPALPLQNVRVYEFVMVEQ